MDRPRTPADSRAGRAGARARLAAARRTARTAQAPSPWGAFIRRALVWSLSLALVAAVVAAVYTSPALAVRRVRVRGLSALTPPEASATLAAAAVPPRTNLLRAPAGALAAAIKRLPWVADAGVARRLPGTLEVRVRPRLPVAVLAEPAGRWEVDAGGWCIRAARAGLQLPVIHAGVTAVARPGAPVHAPGLAAAVEIARSGQRIGPLRTAKIEVDQNAELCLNMKDRIVIRLGQEDDLPAKLALVRRIYEEAPDIGKEVRSIDLRCPEAPACTPRTAGNDPLPGSLPGSSRTRWVDPSLDPRAGPRGTTGRTPRRE